MIAELTASDGHSLDCWIEPAKGKRRGGIVILQEIFGITEQLKSVAARYAELGYEVAVPALFDRRAKGVVVPFAEAPRGRDMMLSSKLDETMMDVGAAVEALKKNGGEVGVIGFCWGGGLAIRAAQILDISAAVAFYGTRLPEYETAPLQAPVQGHWGSDDSHVPPEMLDATRAYFPDMEVFVYEGAGHAFANDARPNDYIAEAAELAHKRTRDFLAQSVG